jgi:lactate dehydrogenase-like 2-hydroxyacid dehydrogenase
MPTLRLDRFACFASVCFERAAADNWIAIGELKRLVDGLVRSIRTSLHHSGNDGDPMKRFTADQVKVGFIGLGNIGSRIAQRLLDHGYQLSVYDRNLRKAIQASHRHLRNIENGIYVALLASSAAALEMPHPHVVVRASYRISDA